ncbi:MAG TPA: lamin tail domain-containing protein [Verrucomicrobiae bacterium]|nr:lamin tail domain-containing protein [Verrucomicrobiae bacterium]
MAADDRCTNVFINGNPTGFNVVGFSALSSTFTINSGLVEGANTLEFRSVNDSTAPNPGAFRAEVRGSGMVTSTNTPLPAGRTTYYFRKSFTYAGDGNVALRLNTLIDDGAIFYLNGQELYRFNMNGTPTNVANPAFSGQIAVPASMLISGDNVLAVEVHQATGDTSDILFDAELVASPLGAAQNLSAVFNEHSAGGADFWVEIVNLVTSESNLENFRIVRDGASDDVFFFGEGTLPLGSFLVLSNSTLGFTVVPGDKLYLFDGTNLLDAIVVKDRARARFPNSSGEWLNPTTITPGAGNNVVFRNEIVINEIMYNHQLGSPSNNVAGKPSREQWIELFNRSGAPVDLTGWELGGGIGYAFSPGQMIPAGGYLVVADDIAALRTLYPSIPMVGNYSGRLSGRSEHIVLRDPAGNPADEVRYYSGGHWPEYADGGGSSLELRDPNADNSKAEAWASSDETGKSAWQTYTYTMQAIIPAGSGQPTQWNDFIMGLQSGGECLIDDITVTETNTGNAMIDNGDFENGLTGWRVLGTHNRSAVIVDPSNPGNHVLRLAATGPQEHMHNHIERTYLAGRAVVPNNGYRITFRARWLAGNNLLNTRLYFNRVGRTTALPTPQLNGTPGAQNSQFAANIGPTFSEFQHQPVIPSAGTPVTVSVKAQDPNGVTGVTLWYSVNGGAWNNTAMSHEGSEYSGTIPGQSSGTVQFYVRGLDYLGATSTFPAGGPDSGALYQIADGRANLPLTHNVRIILTASNINYMHGVAQGNNQTNVMSNDLLPCTVVYDEQRAYYDVGVHLRGSQRGRYSDVRTGFHITFQPDDLFLGQHPVMLVDRSGAGDATANRQEEIILKHMLNRAGGLPGTYSQIAHIIAPRPAHSGSAQWFPRHEDDFIETAFENGGDGTMFEMELIYYPTTANSVGYKLPQPDGVIGTDMTDLGNDKEIYRYNFMMKNHRDTDDYSRFITMCKALSLSGTALDTATRQIMDIDQWMRAYALVSLCSVGDMYTFGNNHNFFMYQRASDGKLLYFPWDMDFTFTRGSSGALVGDQNLGKLVNLPGNLRLMYAHMLDIISTSFNTAYMSYWVDHYDNFAPGQNYSGHLTTIGGRVTYVQSQIASAGGNAAFAVTGTNEITTSNQVLTFTGTAPVTMTTIRVNGNEYPITWTAVNAWRMVVPLAAASNHLDFVGYDLHDVPQTNLTRTVTVYYTGAIPNPDGAIVFNEIMYNPLTPNTAFVELYNRSPFTFDLSDWRINGLDYTFPKGSIITNGQYLLLVNQISAYAAAFGTSAGVPFDEFSGNLQNNGESLTLSRPGTNATSEITVTKVRYENVQPWATSADGQGSSLQLIDAAEDNARVGNWTDATGWRYVTVGGTIQGGASQRGTNFFMYLTVAGDVYIDDMKLVFGSVPEAGANLLTNGDFEDPLSPAWIPQGNHINTVRSTNVSHSGSSSLRIVAPGGGSVSGTGGNNIRQVIAGNPTNAFCTLSFWLLPSTNGSALAIRTAPGSQFTATTSIVPIFATPGAANTVARDIPSFPALYLNEVQPENVSGPLDNQGEREPWIEIYNSGASPINLEGYSLSDNYANLSQWAFPAGSSIAPGEFKTIFADGESSESTASEWHANFRPQAGHGSIALSSGGLVHDYLNYTNVRANWSYGAYPDGQLFTRQAFYHATAGAANDNSAAPITVFVNEWMADNTRTLMNTNNNNRYDDWFELYNPTDLPADLAGYFLTDNLGDPFQYEIPPGYVVPAHGFLLVWADNQPGHNSTNDAALHVNFRLERAGEAIILGAPNGSAIDGITFGPQYEDISQGRYPDGASSTYFLSAATPKAPNTSWINRQPSLALIPRQSALVNQPFAYHVTATDPDGDALSFSLDVAPIDAAIDSNGNITWTPSEIGTNAVTVRVTDDGPLALSFATSFDIVVTTGIRIGSITRSSSTELSISLAAIPGKTYRAEYKDNLEDATWTPIPPGAPAQGSTVSITIPIGPEPHRFFRIVQVD